MADVRQAFGDSYLYLSTDPGLDIEFNRKRIEGLVGRRCVILGGVNCSIAARQTTLVLQPYTHDFSYFSINRHEAIAASTSPASHRLHQQRYRARQEP